MKKEDALVCSKRSRVLVILVWMVMTVHDNVSDFLLFRLTCSVLECPGNALLT